MSNTVIKIENLSKIYRLGEVGTGTLSHDLNRWWKMNIMRQDDPYAKIGHVNDRTQKAEKGEFVAALRDINLEVKQGEVLGIIGKNGAGKSTLLKLLSRVTSPTTGTIKTKGRLATLLEVGTGFHPEMTGRENIYMNGTIMGMRKWEITRKLDEIVDFAGVAKYIDTPVKRYSSGMIVRLGFAVAAFLEPEILIVDEVLAVGDAEFQKKAIGKMQDVSKGQGRTVLFVSHNMGSIKTLCDNAWILANGEKIYEGEVVKAIEYYLYNYHEKENLYEHKKGSRIVEIKDILINGIKNPIISIYENIRIELEFSLNIIEVCDVEFFIIIYDSQGFDLVSIFERDTGKYSTINKTNTKATITFRNQLSPGKYYISAGVFNKNKEFIDWVEFAESFIVEKNYEDGRNFDLRLGKTNIYCDWEIG
jgi:lipopolysaccharide transport system ATP-binding protein